MSVTYWKTFVSWVLGKVEVWGYLGRYLSRPEVSPDNQAVWGYCGFVHSSLLLSLPPTGFTQVPSRASPGTDRPSGGHCTVNLCCCPHRRFCSQQSTQQRYNGPDSRCFSVMWPFRKCQAEPGRSVPTPVESCGGPGAIVRVSGT